MENRLELRANIEKMQKSQGTPPQLIVIAQTIIPQRSTSVNVEQIEKKLKDCKKSDMLIKKIAIKTRQFRPWTISWI